MQIKTTFEPEDIDITVGVDTAKLGYLSTAANVLYSTFAGHCIIKKDQRIEFMIHRSSRKNTYNKIEDGSAV